MQNPILDVIIMAPQLSALLRLMAIHKSQACMDVCVFSVKLTDPSVNALNCRHNSSLVYVECTRCLHCSFFFFV